MKIVFNASLTGKKEYEEHYKKIHELIEKTGNKIVAAPVLMGDIHKKVRESDTKEATDYYQKLIGWTKQADVCVFEVSYPSTSIGHEIAIALQYSKPVVAFHVKDAPENIVLESIKSDRLQVIDYELEKLGRLVEDAIDYASEQMDTRFNFFISPQIGAYLDWVAKEKKYPRAVFLRQLIEEDMKKQDYDI